MSSAISDPGLTQEKMLVFPILIWDVGRLKQPVFEVLLENNVNVKIPSVCSFLKLNTFEVHEPIHQLITFADPAACILHKVLASVFDVHGVKANQPKSLPCLLHKLVTRINRASIHENKKLRLATPGVSRFLFTSYIQMHVQLRSFVVRALLANSCVHHINANV